MKSIVPEKALHLQMMKKGKFDVPDFIYVPAEDFRDEKFEKLERFLSAHPEGFKVIARSAHPDEEAFKPGTFDSLETYADVAGIKYARKRIIKLARTANRLSILRQQKFNNAPHLDIDEMGVLVMPFINGMSVMAKMLGNTWEFGYCRPRNQEVEGEPFLTNTPTTRSCSGFPKISRNSWGIDAKSNTSSRRMAKSTLFRQKTSHILKPWSKRRERGPLNWMA